MQKKIFYLSEWHGSKARSSYSTYPGEHGMCARNAKYQPFFFFFNCNEYSRAPEAVLQLSEVQNGTVQFYLSPVLYGLKSSIVSSIKHPCLY